MKMIKPLPKIMVAPNGARRGKQDHPALPITIAETVATAKACVEQGADGLHMHIRDEQGKHTLDAGTYREALNELQNALPELYVQITTEAVSQYSAAQQRKLVKQLMPSAVSISIAEMLSDNEDKEASQFYNWCRDSNISVQHIIYDNDDLKRIEALSLLDKNHSLQLLFVLGRYTKNQQSMPKDLDPFYEWMQDKQNIDWATCAFGLGETDCLVEAYKRGGKVRIGFENSLWNRDGSIAKNNAERVAELVKFIT
jgi:uncharacterized protein (DUF849 family)